MVLGDREIMKSSQILSKTEQVFYCLQDYFLDCGEYCVGILLACVASGSARVRRENWNESKKRNEGGGGGE